MNRRHADKPTAYTPADRARIAAHLARIDAQVAANRRMEIFCAIATCALVVLAGIALFYVATNY